MANSRHDIYETVTSLRSYTFELLDRVHRPAPAGTADLASAVAVRLQAVAYQLGAVEALMAPVTDRP